MVQSYWWAGPPTGLCMTECSSCLQTSAHLMPTLKGVNIPINMLSFLFFYNGCDLHCSISLVAQMVKNLSAVHETQVQSLCREHPLEKGMATHSSIVWRIQWKRSLVRYSPWGRKESSRLRRLSIHAYQAQQIHIFIFS